MLISHLYDVVIYVLFFSYDKAVLLTLCLIYDVTWTFYDGFTLKLLFDLVMDHLSDVTTTIKWYQHTFYGNKMVQR